MRCLFRLLAVCALFASWALAATGPAPDFYARREYGSTRLCAATGQQVADVNRDGIPDILCSDGHILLGNGNGAFRISPDSWAGSATFKILDLNGNGIPDILGVDLGNTPCFTVSFGNGTGSFESPVVYTLSDPHPEGVAVGDFNGDGIPDGLTIGEAGAWLLTGRGAGKFNDPVLVIPGAEFNSSFQAVDMDGDGQLDLVVTDNGPQSGSGGVSIYFGNGDGTFRAPINYLGSYKFCDITVADINSDSYLDVLCASQSSTEQIAIYFGEAGGKLRKPVFFTLPNYGDVEVGDVNGHGIPDLVSDGVYVAYGLGHGKFSKPVYYPVGGGPTQVVLASLRKPGLIDLITNATFVGLTVLLNKGQELT